MTDTEPVLPGLTVGLKKELLRLARQSIKEHLLRGTSTVGQDIVEGPLAVPRGVFVSLHTEDGALRGCIGHLYADRPLAANVGDMAVQAATADPRFSAMSLGELRATEIELSILSEMRRHPPREVELGRHGLFITRGRHRALMLPQVPGQFGWTREKYLGETCRKAGLGPRAWHSDETTVMVFEAEVFSDGSVADEEEALRLRR